MASGYKPKMPTFDTKLRQSRHPSDISMPVKVLCANGVMLAQPQIIDDPKPIQLANRLRGSAPLSERMIWPFLKAMGFEHSVPLFGYVADFYHRKTSVVIEIDGAVHRDRKHRDRRKDRALKAKGILVYRFWAAEVYRDVAAVVEHIKNVVTIHTPVPFS